MGAVGVPQQFKPKNIYIVGAQCTGKTSLVNALESSLADLFSTTPPIIVREVARSLQALILEAQFNSERDALTRNPWIISDRSGIDPIIYASRHIGSEAVKLMTSSTYWQELRDRMSQSLVFVCETVEDWLVSDGVRLMPRDVEDWKEYDNEFCRMLESAEIPYQMIPRSVKSLEDRVSFVWSRWKNATLA
ncbi:AAA domain-containing protein [Trichoderma breve]|uniref:AAA domain-containing protein n=1 Tax=Trichoderma breve TaxID=2034170 RepID=A0A9W9EDS5_9HYPO|nr:AAA domain-containing protein [Trichoderma breve]KAJ4864835.1 AAA domain-containing protein [Trichoderma breve]